MGDGLSFGGFSFFIVVHHLFVLLPPHRNLARSFLANQSCESREKGFKPSQNGAEEIGADDDEVLCASLPTNLTRLLCLP